MSKRFTLAVVGGLASLFLLTAEAALSPVPLYLDVPVSDVGNDNSLATSNTSRKLAVGADGTIYALFRSATNGIRVARSTDRGQSFGPSVQVSSTSAEAELAISNDGDLHVTWVTGGNIFHAISRDGAETFSTPVTVGAGLNSAHMALDGDRVYIVPRNGSTVYRSTDDGATFASTATGGSYAFADIFVDPLTSDVLVVVDSPAVSFYKSSDFAQTFVGPTATGRSVMYSVGALAATDSGRYVFMAGSGTNLERIEVDTPAYYTGSIQATASSTTRSLSADIFGNVVSGYLEAGTNDLKFEHSNDLGVTFASPTTVVANATTANAAINIINGDILFLYQKNNQIFLSTYARALINYDISVAPSALNFDGVDVGMTKSLPLELKNESEIAVAIASMTASTDFSVTHNCGATLAAGATCTATVTFAPTVTGTTSGSLTMTFGSTTRLVSLSGNGLPPRQPTSVALEASDDTPEVGTSITLTATVTGSSVTGTVDFKEGSTAIAGCSGVALAGATASCVVDSLTAGVKLYSAAYGGDATNAPSTSTATKVIVGSFTVTPDVSAGGSLDPSAPQTVRYGETATLTAEASSGYELTSISGCGGTRTGKTFTTAPITADCTVTAKFTLIQQDPDDDVEEEIEEDVQVVAKSKGGGGAMTWPMLLLGALGVLARRGALLSFATLLMLGRANAEESRWFVGAAIGQARGEQGTSEVEADLARRGFTAAEVQVHDLDRTAYRLFAGYRVTDSVYAQAGYTDLGEVPTTAQATVEAGQAEAYARALLESLPVAASGYEASVGYRYAINDAFGVGARVGLWRWQNELRASFGNTHLKAEPEGTDALLGVSFDWSFAQRWAVGIEASRYRTDKEDIDLLSGNVKFFW